MAVSVSGVYKKIRDNIGRVIVGNEEAVDLLIAALFCRGHALAEDVPGTGKTMLVKSLAASLDLPYSRIQFTPDLLPSDITGINFFNMKKSEFEFIPGPVFASIVLADEINRATPKTQAGLLECMEENQVTIDGKRFRLRDPFMVVATQNPVESMGVFPLPEAQLDRFLFRFSLGYPSHENSVGILQRFDSAQPLSQIKPVAGEDEINECRLATDRVYVAVDLMNYITSLCEASRNADGVVLGVSPRGALALMRASKALAAISGRDYVLPDDVKRAAVPVMAHRLVLTDTARIKRRADTDIIGEILHHVPVPTEAVFERML